MNQRRLTPLMPRVAANAYAFRVKNESKMPDPFDASVA